MATNNPFKLESQDASIIIEPIETLEDARLRSKVLRMIEKSIKVSVKVLDESESVDFNI